MYGIGDVRLFTYSPRVKHLCYEYIYSHMRLLACVCVNVQVDKRFACSRFQF